MKRIKMLLIAIMAIGCMIAHSQDSLYIYYSGTAISKTAIAAIDSITFIAPEGYSSVKDFEGNIYPTVKIGDQTWMRENLKATRYSDGTVIYNVYENSDWEVSGVGAYCLYDNDTIKKPMYGAIYNHYAVNTDKLCPIGWHVPADSEWNTMIDFLKANNYIYDGTTIGEGVAKALGTAINWLPSAQTGSVGNDDYPAYRNKSGFTGTPGGFRYANGSYAYEGSAGYWWTATVADDNNAWCRGLYYSLSYVSKDNYNRHSGAYVRCVKN